MRPKYTPALQALLAAVLFGASAPLAKLLLGEVQPVPLAAFLYLGSGMGAFLMLLFQGIRNKGQRVEARLSRGDIPWLGGALLAGGIGAPIILLLGLERTPASTASLLLNFEGVATTLIAITFFKESIDRRIAWAIGLVTLASIVLTWTGGNWGFSLGALGIIGACFLWGLDNNFTRHISAKNPLVIVGIKGLGAGTFSLVLCLIIRQPLPTSNHCPTGNAAGVDQLRNQHPVIHCCLEVPGSGTDQHPVWNCAICGGRALPSAPEGKTTDPILGSPTSHGGRSLVDADRKPRPLSYPPGNGA